MKTSAECVCCCLTCGRRVEVCDCPDSVAAVLGLPKTEQWAPPVDAVRAPTVTRARSNHASRVLHLNYNTITLIGASDTGRFQPGDIVRASCQPHGPMRFGQMRVLVVDMDNGAIEVDAAHQIAGLADYDFLFVMESAAHSAVVGSDIAALEAYLASCVRRRDWHGVSDAANDLRVLEERQRR